MSHLIRMFQSFRYSNYRLLWLVVAFTNAAMWSFTLAVTAQIYALTSSSFWSGALVFASMAPNLVGAPLVGVLADKLQRKFLILAAIFLNVVVLAVLTTVTFMHLVSPTVMIVLTLLFGLGSSTIGVSVNALVPTLVPKQGLYNAYSLQAVGQRGTEFVGPIVAAPLLATLGAPAVYVFCAVIYLAAIWFVAKLTGAKIENVSREPFFRSFARGVSYIRSSQGVLFMILLVGLHCALTMAFLGMLPLFVHQNLALSTHSTFYGVLMSMIGLGAIIGTLVLAVVESHRTRQVLFWVSAVFSGLSLSLLGMTTNPLMSVLAILLVGSSQAVFMTISISLVQEFTAEEVRGRVTGVYFVVAAGLMSFANWFYGGLGVIVSPRFIMLTTGLLFVIIVGIYWYAVARKPGRHLSVTVSAVADSM